MKKEEIEELIGRFDDCTVVVSSVYNDGKYITMAGYYPVPVLKMELESNDSYFYSYNAQTKKFEVKQEIVRENGETDWAYVFDFNAVPVQKSERTDNINSLLTVYGGKKLEQKVFYNAYHEIYENGQYTMTDIAVMLLKHPEMDWALMYDGVDPMLDKDKATGITIRLSFCTGHQVLAEYVFEQEKIEEQTAEQEKAVETGLTKENVIAYLKNVDADVKREILQECNIQTIECLQAEDVPDEIKEEIATDWIAENPNLALSLALDNDADKDDIIDNWFNSIDVDGLLDKANDNFYYSEIAHECINRMG